MARKPTGKPNGRPLQLINLESVEDINYESHTGKNWDALFDIYIEFEKAGTPSSILENIQTLIEQYADSDTLQVRAIIDELINRACKTKSLKVQNAIMGHFSSELKKLSKKSHNPKLSRIINSTVSNITSLRKLNKFLSRNELEILYYETGTNNDSELKFILETLNKIVSYALRNGFVAYSIKTKGRDKPLKKKIFIDNALKEESILSKIAFAAYLKILRAQKIYDVYKNEAQRYNFIRQNFISTYLDYLKEYNKEDYCPYTDPDYEKKQKKWA